MFLTKLSTNPNSEPFSKMIFLFTILLLLWWQLKYHWKARNLKNMILVFYLLEMLFDHYLFEEGGLGTIIFNITEFFIESAGYISESVKRWTIHFPTRILVLWWTRKINSKLQQIYFSTVRTYSSCTGYI